MNRSYFIVLAIGLVLFAILLYAAELYMPRQKAGAPADTTPKVVAPKKDEQSRAAPEGESGLRDVAEVSASSMMVAAANGHASRAGLFILKAGGNAVDAAIAVQMVLNVVEPQSSGIGGGAFLLFWDGGAKRLKSYDGREVAPAAVNERLFLREDGSALAFGEAVRSGRSIGVPGLVAMLEMVHQRHGKLPWEQLFAPAIQLAGEGFAVSNRLSRMLTMKGREFFNAEAQALFFPDETAVPVGTVLKNPALAASLKLIAEGGAKAFYEGEIAEKIIEAAGDAPAVASEMVMDDLAQYKALEREPVCGGYLAFRVCGMGAPSSGGMTVAMILKLIEPLPLGKAPSVNGLHLIAEAEKLAFADRGRYMADPDFVPQPRGFLEEAYMAERRKLIDAKKAMTRAEPGDPPLAQKSALGRDGTFERGGTSHISIVDGDGNVVSMTSSIEGAFGSGQMAGGFLLNNELTDFSFKPLDDEGREIANRVAPLKRPRSSMAPTIVFDKANRPRIVVGSPGGSRIIPYVVKAIVAHVNWQMGPQEAVSLYNFGSRNGPFELEARDDTASLVAPLEARGQTVRSAVMTSGIQMIVMDKGRLRGGADPRREGLVVGE